MSFYPQGMRLKSKSLLINNNIFTEYPLSQQMVTAAMKLKDAYSLEEKL